MGPIHFVICSFLFVTFPNEIFSMVSTRRPTNSKFDTIVSVKSRNEVRNIFHTDDPNVSLTRYMNLPIEQYALIKLPLGATLTKEDDSPEFKLTVPNEF